MTALSDEMQAAAVKLGLQIRDRVERALVKCHHDLGADFYQTLTRCGAGANKDGLGMFVTIDNAPVWQGAWVRDGLNLEWTEAWLREPREFVR